MERKTDGERAKRRIADAGRQRARATAAVPRKPHGGDPPSLCHPGAKNLGNREVLSLQVRDEQALFVPLLAFFANWTLANRKFLGQIFPLRVF